MVLPKVMSNLYLNPILVWLLLPRCWHRAKSRGEREVIQPTYSNSLFEKKNAQQCVEQQFELKTCDYDMTFVFLRNSFCYSKLCLYVLVCIFKDTVYYYYCKTAGSAM